MSTAKHITVTVPARKYEDHDDSLTAAADAYLAAHPTIPAGYDLSPRWADDSREEIALDVPAWSQHIGCQCGEWSGEACQWSGPEPETVVVEYMPEQHRASHTAAGNSGSYPHNGARRIRVERSCADRMVEHDGDWVTIL